MLNKVQLQGRLTKDIELKNTGNGTSVCSFSIACDRDFVSKDTNQRECDFFNITAWRQTAEFAEKWFHKGDMMVIDGRLQQRKYTDRDGNNRTTVEVLANNIYFGGSKRDSQDGYQGNQTGGTSSEGHGGWQQTQQNPFNDDKNGAIDGFMNVPDGIEEELPFN